MYLQDFTFTIAYRKEKTLPHVDYLSRNPPQTVRLVADYNWDYMEQKGNEEVQTLLHQLRDVPLNQN